MSDSILCLNGAATLNSGAIGATRAGQQVSKVLVDKLLASIDQAGQAAMQSPPNRIDRVQISAEAQQLLAAEQAQEA